MDFPRLDLAWPKGDNDSDIVLGNRHFNLTTLEHWNYTLYQNGTLSNNSKCWLTYAPHLPVRLLDNGTFVNATACWSAVDHLGVRGYTGIGVAIAFALVLVCVVTVLAKHGRLYLPAETRFTPIGRRWQWYWGSWVCACALISLFINVDVDRYHVQELPLIVTVFFWYLMCMGSMAVVWEAVRHWGSWQERQYIDPNPFMLREDDRRARTEFWLPLFFYLLVWLNFFMVVPRDWTFAYKQRSPEQMAAIAVPNATGARFKAAAFLLLAAWCTIFFSMWHSIKHYKPRNRGIFNRIGGLITSLPLRFVLLLPLSLGLVAYQVLISFDFQWSIIKADGPVAIIYGWGYGIQLAILIVQVAYGFASPNEDKELIRQRRIRGDAADRELGLVKKPAWWRRVKGEHLTGTFRDKLLKNVREVGQAQTHGQGVGRREEGDMERAMREQMEAEARDDEGIEMRTYRGKREHNPREDRAGVRNVNRQDANRQPTVDPLNPLQPLDPAAANRIVNRASGLLFPDPDDVERRDREAEAERARRLAYIQEDGPPPPYKDGNTITESLGRTDSTGTISSVNAPPMQIRSMLDI